MPSEAGDTLVPGQSSENSTIQAAEAQVTKTKDFAEGKQDSGQPPTPTSMDPQGDKSDKGGRARKTSRSGEPFDQAEREEMERLLEELQGHLGKCWLHLHPDSPP